MFDNERHHLASFTKLVEKGADKMWNEAFDLDILNINLEKSLRSAPPRVRKTIKGDIKSVRKEAKKLRGKANTQYDIAASLDWSIRNED